VAEVGGGKMPAAVEQHHAQPRRGQFLGDDTTTSARTHHDCVNVIRGHSTPIRSS